MALAVAPAVALAGFGAIAAVARASNTVDTATVVAGQSGVKFVFKYGPLCYPAKHYCTYKKLAGWNVTLFKGTRAIKHGVTNSAGTVTFYAPPGRYTYTFSGALNGKVISRRGSAFPILPGRVIPFYEAIAPPS